MICKGVPCPVEASTACFLALLNAFPFRFNVSLVPFLEDYKITHKNISVAHMMTTNMISADSLEVQYPRDISHPEAGGPKNGKFG